MDAPKCKLCGKKHWVGDSCVAPKPKRTRAKRAQEPPKEPKAQSCICPYCNEPVDRALRLVAFGNKYRDYHREDMKARRKKQKDKTP